MYLINILSPSQILCVNRRLMDCECTFQGFKVLKEHCNINCRLYSFVCRNVNVWNSLPDHVVNSDSVAIFKRRLSSLNMSSS